MNTREATFVFDEPFRFKQKHSILCICIFLCMYVYKYIYMHASYILHLFGGTSIYEIAQYIEFAKLIFIKQVKIMKFCVKPCSIFFHNPQA